MKKIVFVFLLFTVSTAQAKIANFDLAGRLYTKWLYRNDGSQGLLNYGNPFWPDNMAGDNGVGSEFELKIFGRVSKYVQTYVRLKSRFGALWQDWWENGDIKYGGAVNTSGESMGMNHAEYIKLRGFYVRFAPPIPGVDWVTVGSSDLGMFNAWTIGKVRFIDRDNGKGWFIDGHIGKAGVFQYNLAIIALPKLYVGPWWSTGVGDPKLDNPFYSQDWAYAAKLNYNLPIGSLTLISDLTNDVEVDITDPDAVGSLYPDCKDALGHPILGCSKDHAVDYHSRFFSSNTTFEANLSPLDWLTNDLLLGLSYNRPDMQLTANAVADNQGISPIVEKKTLSYAVRERLYLDDPFDVGLSFKFEYFNIGADWNSIFGARRESDVLLTDGFLGGGQLPTLNLANEFMDFDEAFVESCIGWHGGTAILDYDYDAFTMSVEGTFITYNTNGQNRDVDKTYPNFLHTNGYTDTDLFSYADVNDRGRDPRSVYHRNQDRRTWISVLKARYTFDVLNGFDLGIKAKYIYDKDFRSHKTASDDYTGNILILRPSLRMNVADGLVLELGDKVGLWWEKNREGSLEQGYGDYTTHKNIVYCKLGYQYEGISLAYLFQWVRKKQYRQRQDNQYFSVLRSKATLEVNW